MIHQELAGRTRIAVVLVTADDCHFCQQAKEVIGRLHQDYDLEIQEVALLSEEGQALARRHGIVFPPGIVIDGDFVGFGRPSEKKLRRVLDRRLTSPAARN